MVEAFNHMLDRLDLAFSRQRRFVSDASHELRTPLTAIRGQLEVLAREETPERRADVRRVEALAMTEMRRVERLVDDLLALARLDEGIEPAPARGRGRLLPARPRRGRPGRQPRSASWPRGPSASTPT